MESSGLSLPALTCVWASRNLTPLWEMESTVLGTLRAARLVRFSFWMLFRVDSVPRTSFTSVEPRYSAMYLNRAAGVS